jgi:transposase InsO family protein
MDAITIMNKRYGIQFEEAMTDNGGEFCEKEKTLREHPFERLLMYFSIKHIRTQAYRPQTNGKIERFWRSFDDEVIEGAVFETLDDLKNAVLGYNFYFAAVAIEKNHLNSLFLTFRHLHFVGLARS